ncbi:hypothetical protein ACFYW6_15775 [Streptomyces sp. NPDC002659]|uniref:hypothetical protein n=1 Tax=Streptomyces sp. NPDC002659 TaxID=3364656 RepID=UPI0036B91AEB
MAFDEGLAERIRERLGAGWVVVAATAIAEDRDLDAWIEEGRAFAAGLPPK